MLVNIDELKNEFPILEYYIYKWKNELNENNKYINLAFIKFCLEVSKNEFIDIKTRQRLLEYENRLSRMSMLEQKYFTKWKMYNMLCKPSINNYDLQFNSINQNDKTNIYYIDLENKKKYLFTQSDFRKLIENYLFHSWVYDYIPDPIPIKNPYDNHIFTKKELENLDNQILNPPIIWTLYKDSEYCVDTLKINYNYYLLKNCLNSYISNLENDDIYYYLEDILLYSQYYNDEICKECLDNESLYRLNPVKQGIYKWVKSLKFQTKFTHNDYLSLKNIFRKPCKIHDRVKRCLRKEFDESGKFVFDITKNYSYNFVDVGEDVFYFNSEVTNSSKTKSNIIKDRCSVKKDKKKKIKTIDFFKFTSSPSSGFTNSSTETSKINVELKEEEGRIVLVLAENEFNGNTFIKNIL